MKHITRTLIFIFVLATLLLSACAGAAAPATNAADKVQADLVEFTGVIEAINGTQWTINGQIVTVDPSVVRDGPFQVGDTVKLEAQVAQDGSVVVTRVETPSAPAADNGNTNSADSGNTNSVDNGNSNSNSNSNDNSSTPGTTGGLVFDDSGSEAFGSVDSITADAVVIGGQTFTLTNGSEFKGLIAAGDFVKVHFVLNADGTYTIVEIETWDPAAVSNSNSNSNDDNGNGNDDNGNSNSNDDNGNGNDDNSNDDNGNDDNSNDDNGNDDNGNDDNGNDDNSNGNGNGNGNG